jgi:hypothetical protein
MQINGSCHCGKITYRAEANPEKVYICHCTDCQAISGSPFRWFTAVPEEDYELLSGQPKTYIKIAENGDESHQVFCPDCASPLYSTTSGDGPKWYYVRLGTAEQRNQLKPTLQVWHRSAQQWVDEIDQFKSIETQ